MNDHLRERVFNIIEPAIFNNADTYYLDVALDNLEALIQAEIKKQVTLGKIVELERLNVDLGSEAPEIGKSTKAHNNLLNAVKSIVKDRIAALQSELGEKEL